MALAPKPEHPLSRPLTADEVVARVQLMQQIMARVMKEETHYGIVKGCKKPSLWKAGAEVLLVAFRLSAGEPTVEDLSENDIFHFRVTVPIVDPQTGHVWAVGVGERTSRETKYNWREVDCPAEWEATPPEDRRISWKYGKEKQCVRTNPADVCNTVLKMAHKSAIIAGTLLATGASDIFAQDLEDMEHPPKDVEYTEEEPLKRPQSKHPPQQPTGDVISEAQRKRMFAILLKESKGDTDKDARVEALKTILALGGIDSTTNIPRKEYEGVCKQAEKIAKEASSPPPPKTGDVPF